MDTYERNPSYKKPVLSDPTCVFHLFFQSQVQLQSCFLLKLAGLLFPLKVVLLRMCECQAVWLRKVALPRILENRAALDSVPPKM